MPKKSLITSKCRLCQHLENCIFMSFFNELQVSIFMRDFYWVAYCFLLQEGESALCLQWQPTHPH